MSGRHAREPLGAGAKASVPAGAGIEVVDEVQQVGGRRIEMCGQLGDLIANPLGSAIEALVA
jgi:hypothetical protein